MCLPLMAEKFAAKLPTVCILRISNQDFIFLESLDSDFHFWTRKIPRINGNKVNKWLKSLTYQTSYINEHKLAIFTLNRNQPYIINYFYDMCDLKFNWKKLNCADINKNIIHIVTRTGIGQKLKIKTSKINKNSVYIRST